MNAMKRGFTLIELIVVIALLSIVFFTVLAVLTNVQRDARDRRRVTDLEQIHKALELYHADHAKYPSEREGANGNIATNQTFKNMLRPYVSGELVDPAGIGNSTFYYYYDGAHRCGDRLYAIVFARQMDRAMHANYETFFATTCAGVLDGEGRGGGRESYNIRIGPNIE